VMLDTLRRWVPITYNAFCQYRLGGFHLSSKGLDAVKRLLAGEKIDQRASGLSAREWREMMAALGRDG
ncbi:MAG: thymidylate synthase (FAD), partial [Alphaproteobacteria bacterium]